MLTEQDKNELYEYSTKIDKEIDSIQLKMVKEFEDSFGKSNIDDNIIYWIARKFAELKMSNKMLMNILRVEGIVGTSDKDLKEMDKAIEEKIEENRNDTFD